MCISRAGALWRAPHEGFQRDSRAPFIVPQGGFPDISTRPLLTLAQARARGTRRTRKQSGGRFLLAWSEPCFEAPPMNPMTRAFLIAAALTASSGCRPKQPADTTALVVGIQSDSMGGIVSGLHIVVRVAGAVVDDEIVKPPHGSRVGFPQPWEKTLSGAGKGTAQVEVQVDAIGDPSAPAPLFTRLSSTHFVPGRSLASRDSAPSRAAWSTRRRRVARARSSRAPERSRVYGAGDVHLGRLPVARSSGRASRALRQELAEHRPRSMQGAQRRAARFADRYRAVVLPAARERAGPAGGGRPARGAPHLDRHPRMKNLKQAGSTTEDHRRPTRHRR